jgi:hypothetical protein
VPPVKDARDRLSLGTDPRQKSDELAELVVDTDIRRVKPLTRDAPISATPHLVSETQRRRDRTAAVAS